MGQSLLRSLFGTLCILFCSLPTQAQLVFIPDTNLRDALNEWVPGCMDGSGMLDTGIPTPADSTMTLEVRWTPADLTGLGSIPVLKRLTVRSTCSVFPDTWVPCATNSISAGSWPADLRLLSLAMGTYPALPEWPLGVEDLVLTGLVTPAIPDWPSSLSVLIYEECTGHATIPDLPSGVHRLVLAGPTDLSQLPTVPGNVTDLTVRDPAGGQFPDIPGSVTQLTLDASEAALAMPALPNSIIYLYLSGFTQPEPFTSFPSGLEHLTLFYNYGMTALPALPGTLEALEILECPDLQTLPVLPQRIRNMSFAAVPLNGLDDFPDSLRTLMLASIGGVQCLPLFPDSLEELNLNPQEVWSATLIPCFPNAPAGLLIKEPGSWEFLPMDPARLCTVLNSTCDFVNPAATGSVYWDQNANGARDGGEPGYPLATVNAQPGNITFGVAASGDFNQPLPLDQYTLTGSSNNPYVLSISPASHDAPFVNATDVDTGNDFGVVLQPDVQDVRIDLEGPWGRSGFESIGHITYDNIGSTTVDGTVTFQLDASQSWLESDPAPTSVSGNSITWDYAALQIGERRSIWINVYTDPGVPLGTQLQHTATVGPVASDETPADNTATSNTVVEGSWDPNDKRVEPTVLTPTEVAAGEEVIYTIRFQNTGTYQADRVIITDELSSDLQWSTMRLINSSHPCTWVLSNEGLLRFTFEPIFLPDSTSDEPNSHGYVRFAMKPLSDLVLGESVSNTANIYFDLNEPVLTNEAVFTVDASTEVQGHEQGQVRVWPNPAKDVLFVEGASGPVVDVLDMTGRVVKTARPISDVSAIGITDLLPGMYTLRAREGNAYFVEKFTKY